MADNKLLVLGLIGIGAIGLFALRAKATVCENGDVRELTCSDNSVIITHQCFNGEWISTGNTCPTSDFGIMDISVT